MRGIYNLNYMPQERIKYYGSFTYNERFKRSEYKLFDPVNNTSLPQVVIKGTKEEGWLEYGKAQKEYYIKYPRLLLKGITVTAENKSNNFQLCLYIPNSDSGIFLDSFITVQDAIRFKKELFALNVE